MKRVNQFVRARNGNIAILFAFLLVPLVMFAGGAIDFARYNTVRTDLTESLDSAGLAMAQLDAINGPDIRDLSGDARKEHLKAYGRQLFHENFKYESLIDNLEVDFVVGNTTITPTATGTLDTLILHLADALTNSADRKLTTLAMTSNTEITRAATGNTEVALVLDTTGSMNSDNKMSDLKVAAKEFVDVLVRDDQSTYYSKVAIVPYGGSVNLGAQASNARGSIAPGVTITSISKSSPAIVTTSGNHGFSDGDFVVIKGAAGMSQVNNTGENVYKVHNSTATTFRLRTPGNSNVDSRSWGTYTANSGQVYCTNTGCRYKYFTNKSGSRRLYEPTNCVSERTGAQAYTETDVTTAPVGYVYGPIGGAYMCPPSQVAGLTSSRSDAKATIDALAAAGNTGGHIGIAWGWYAVSPNFSNFFTGDSAPAAYDDSEVAKSIVIMTDGEYNSSYCNGVVSQSSTSGSGSASDQINCNAPNGHAYAQSLALCAEMKKQGVKVYTVGFKIVDSQNARDMMAQCASGTGYAYLAEDGPALKRVFSDIAQNIAQLHVSR